MTQHTGINTDGHWTNRMAQMANCNPFDTCDDDTSPTKGKDEYDCAGRCFIYSTTKTLSNHFNLAKSPHRDQGLPAAAFYSVVTTACVTAGLPE